MGIGPPCRSIRAPVTVTDEQILVDMTRAAIAAVDCEEPVASMDAWVDAFIGQPIDDTWACGTFVMTNEIGSLTVQPRER